MYTVIVNLLDYSFLILGIVFLIVSITVPRKLMFPDLKKVKLINEQGYIRSQRVLFSSIGICYIVLGVLLILKILSLSIVMIPATFLPLVLWIFTEKINRKYLHKLDL